MHVLLYPFAMRSELLFYLLKSLYKTIILLFMKESKLAATNVV